MFLVDVIAGCFILRELLPTEQISRGTGAPRPLDDLAPAAFADMRQAIDALTFLPQGSDTPMTWEASLAANYTDGMLILHKGRVVYERYFGCLREDGQHAAMSMTKSVTGLLAQILVAEGALDESARVGDLIPEVGRAEQDAYQTVDGKGVPFAGGGLSAGLRDLGRLGQLMLDEGRVGDRQIFPAEVAQRIAAGGDRAKFGTGFASFGAGSYTSQWWVTHNAHGAYAARGVHGQTIYVDPTAQMVLVRFASYPRAQNGFIDPTSMPAYQAVAEFLMALE